MVIKARWVHTIPTPSSTTAPLSSTSTQSCPFHCINIQLHKHSVRLTLRPGPEAVGGTHFLITDASSILTHHRSGENSWSLSLLGCRVFSSITQLLHQAPKCTASGCAQPCVDHKCAESTKYAHTHTCTVATLWWGPSWDLFFFFDYMMPTAAFEGDFLSEWHMKSRMSM